MTFSLNNNWTLSNRRSKHSTKVNSLSILSLKHLNYFLIFIWTLFLLENLKMTLFVAIFPSVFIVMVWNTKRIFLMLGILVAIQIYIRIPKSKKNAEMQIKKLDFIKTIIFMNSIKSLKYLAWIQKRWKSNILFFKSKFFQMETLLSKYKVQNLTF